MDVAEAAAAAAGDDNLLAVLDDVEADLARLLVDHGRPAGDVDDEVAPVPPEHPLPAARLAVFGEEPGGVENAEQGVDMTRGAEDDIASAPAISAVGAAEFDVRLAAEAGRSIPAPSRLDMDRQAIYKQTFLHARSSAGRTDGTDLGETTPSLLRRRA